MRLSLSRVTVAERLAGAASTFHRLTAQGFIRMTSKYAILLSIKVATVVAWIVAAVDVSPWGPELDPDASLFVIAAACVSSYAWISKAHARPAVELFLAGKDIGRREALLEQECDRVTRLSERHLTVVGGDR